MPRPDGIQFRFTKGNVRSMDTREWIHNLEAVQGEQVIGRLEWYPKSRTVKDVFVEEPFRRQGVATGMWEEAHQIAQTTRGVQPPKHSPQRTAAGTAWAKSVGGRLPRSTSN